MSWDVRYRGGVDASGYLEIRSIFETYQSVQVLEGVSERNEYYSYQREVGIEPRIWQPMKYLTVVAIGMVSADFSGREIIKALRSKNFSRLSRGPGLHSLAVP